MPEVSGMVLEGQDPEMRIDQVISSATWITVEDMPLVQQGKIEVMETISSGSWVAPYVWKITWINIPAQEAQQSVTTDVTGTSGVMI